MHAKVTRGVITPNQSYVCLYCRLQSSSLVGRRTTRYQHTAPPENSGADENKESIPKDAESSKDPVSPSRIGDIIRSFMFRSDAKDTETTDDLRIENHGKIKQSPPLPARILSTTPQPKDDADGLQRKLQQKFAARRREDMLEMQASQALKAAEENEEVSKAQFVPESTKRSPKKSFTRAERSEQRRRLKKAEFDQRTMKGSKQKQAKPVDVPLNEVAEITTSTEPQIAEEPSTDIEASVGKIQGTLAADGKEANDNDSKGNVPTGQGEPAQKMDDIMDILESSKKKKKLKPPMKAARKAKKPLKNRKKPEAPVKVIRKAKEGSTDTKKEAAGVATLNKNNKSEENSDEDSRKVAAMIESYSSQLLAHLKANPEEASGSLHQLKMLQKRLLAGNDSLVRKITMNGLPAPSIEPAMEIALSKRLSKGGIREHLSECKEHIPTNESKISPTESFVSLQAALEQIGKVKGAEPDSRQVVPSGKVEKARAPPNTPSRKVKNLEAPPKSPSGKIRKAEALPKSPIEKVTASDLEIMPIEVDQPRVPSLAYGLERVLFNPGVYQLQDPRSRVYNFDPYLQKIMPVAEFDFSALKEYVTSSRDQALTEIAKQHGKRYMGSTSSMTAVLAHLHFLLSQWRPINPSMLSKAFPAILTSFTEHQRLPSAIFLRWKDGSYAIDADKQFDSANVLMMLGKSMEKMLTSSTDDFERYRKSSPGQVTEDEQSAPESFHYSTLGDFLMRSQLDAHDPRLPGTGMFDLKTRSVVSIRMDVTNYEHGVGYEIKSRQGVWESYEREYHDMIRAAFLKYSLQVRMGRMDGIFVAFHNIERIFGFQYISLPEMDSTLHGQWDTSVGDQEFRLSLDLLNKVLDRATKKFPNTSLRIHFETRDVQTPFMYIFAEPVTEEQVAKIQSQNHDKIKEFERNILGLTRGMGSATDETQEDDSRWENIQADVQEAMDKDELSIDDPSQDQGAIDEHAEGTESAPDRPEVFDQGPLYTSKSLAGADDDVTAASAGSEEDDGGSEDDNDADFDGEEEREDEAEEEEEEDRDGDADEDGEVEKSRQQDGLEECLEDNADIKINDAIEANCEVHGDSAEENHSVKVQNDANLPTGGHNEDGTTGAISRQGSAADATESTNGTDDISISPNAKPSSIPGEEGQQEGYQSKADQRFLDSIDQEVAQTINTAETSPEDILAMTLTLRNKVNGEYVLRPEKMTAADEWSIEYSLTEVTEQPRARALYQACQKRRSKKMGASLASEDADVVSDYVQRLREMSAKGRAWRKEQDKKDKKRPVQVL